MKAAEENNVQFKFEASVGGGIPALRPLSLCLTGNRISDGFNQLADKRRLELSLEALVVDKRFTGLFSDEEANNALMRLLDAGYRF